MSITSPFLTSPSFYAGYFLCTEHKVERHHIDKFRSEEKSQLAEQDQSAKKHPGQMHGDDLAQNAENAESGLHVTAYPGLPEVEHAASALFGGDDLAVEGSVKWDDGYLFGAEQGSAHTGDGDFGGDLDSNK